MIDVDITPYKQDDDILIRLDGDYGIECFWLRKACNRQDCLFISDVEATITILEKIIFDLKTRLGDNE